MNNTISFDQPLIENLPIIFNKIAETRTFNAKTISKLRFLVAADNSRLRELKEKGKKLTQYKAIIPLGTEVEYLIDTVEGMPSIIYGLPISLEAKTVSEHQKLKHDLFDMWYKQHNEGTITTRSFYDNGYASLLDQYDNMLIQVQKVSRDESSILLFENGLFIIDTDDMMWADDDYEDVNNELYNLIKKSL